MQNMLENVLQNYINVQMNNHRVLEGEQVDRAV